MILTVNTQRVITSMLDIIFHSSSFQNSAPLDDQKGIQERREHRREHADANVCGRATSAKARESLRRCRNHIAAAAHSHTDRISSFPLVVDVSSISMFQTTVTTTTTGITTTITQPVPSHTLLLLPDPIQLITPPPPPSPPPSPTPTGSPNVDVPFPFPQLPGGLYTLRSLIVK